MKHSIQGLQEVLQLSDEYVAEKLGITVRVFNNMKNRGIRTEYLRVKSILIDERYRLIKFLK